MITTILSIFKNFKNIIIIALALLFFISVGVSGLYKIRYDKLKIKTQKEQIEFYKKAKSEVKKHTDRINKLSAEKEALKKQIDALDLEGKRHNEDYYRIIDSITDRFHRGL